MAENSKEYKITVRLNDLLGLIRFQDDQFRSAFLGLMLYMSPPAYELDEETMKQVSVYSLVHWSISTLIKRIRLFGDIFVETAQRLVQEGCEEPSADEIQAAILRIRPNIDERLREDRWFEDLITAARSPAEQSECDRSYREKRFIEALREFIDAADADVVRHLRDKRIIEPLREFIERYGREVYLVDNFEVDETDATNFLSICKPSPHGRKLPSHDGKGLYLPDLGMSIRYIVSSAHSPLPAFSIEHLEAWDRTHLEDMIRFDERNDFEIHLCDSVWEAYEISRHRRDELLESADLPLSEKLERIRSDERSSRAYPREFDIRVVTNCPAITMWRTLTRSTSLAGHGIARESVLRQSLGRPIISGLFPKQLWDGFGQTVRDFLTDAGRRAGAEPFEIQQLGLPSKKRLQEAILDIIMHENKHVELDIAKAERLLDQLGLTEAIHHLHEDRLDPVRRTLEAVYEYNYSEKYDETLRLRPVFELQALHKRVLGLLENDVIRRIQSEPPGAAEKWKKLGNPKKWKALGAAEKWKKTALAACADMDDFDAKYKSDDELAEHIIYGTWLILARDPGKVRLTELLQLAVEHWQDQVSLSGEDWIAVVPDKHFSNLSKFRSTNGIGYRRSLMFLGRLMIEVRNFVEHGTDEPEGNCLKIINEEFWNRRYKKARGENSVQIWALASKVPAENDLAGQQNQILIDGESLKNCLELCSLTISSARYHFKDVLGEEKGS